MIFIFDELDLYFHLYTLFEERIERIMNNINY